MSVREITTLIPAGSATAAAEKTICLAVLRVGARIALQLRDERPDINNPGCWGLFGGSLRDGETPEQGVVREIREETGLQISPLHLFALREERNPFHRCSVGLEVFEADVTDAWHEHRVREGQRSALYTREEIERLGPLAPLAHDVLHTYFERGPE